MRRATSVTPFLRHRAPLKLLIELILDNANTITYYRLSDICFDIISWTICSSVRQYIKHFIRVCCHFFRYLYWLSLTIQQSISRSFYLVFTTEIVNSTESLGEMQRKTCPWDTHFWAAIMRSAISVQLGSICCTQITLCRYKSIWFCILSWKA